MHKFSRSLNNGYDCKSLKFCKYVAQSTVFRSIQFYLISNQPEWIKGYVKCSNILPRHSFFIKYL